MKYQSELAKINKTEDKMPPKLKAYVKSINELLETKAEIQRLIAAKEGNPEELQTDLSACEADITNLDNELSAKVIKWGEQIERLTGAREKKQPKQPAAKKAATSPVTPPPPAPIAQAAPISAPVPNEPVIPTPAVEPEPVVIHTEPLKVTVDPEPAKKKGNGVGWIVFGVLALVVTVGAVNLLKKG